MHGANCAGPNGSRRGASDHISVIAVGVHDAGLQAADEGTERVIFSQIPARRNCDCGRRNANRLKSRNERVVGHLSGRKYCGNVSPFTHLPGREHSHYALHPSLPGGGDNMQNAEFLVRLRHEEWIGQRLGGSTEQA